MRVVAEIPHPRVKITIFNWNNRYLIKLEQGALEQTYKVSEFDVLNEVEVIKIVDDKFLEESVVRFEDMACTLSNSIQRNEVI